MPDDWEQTNRRAAYACDITYGTNSEFGFDYLRDNMAAELAQTVQRGHWFAIVDEVDSILIDEARTPLIISGAARGGGRDLLRVRPRRPRPRSSATTTRSTRSSSTAAPTEEGVDQGRAGARGREPVRARERPAREPPDPGDQGQGALQARRRVRRRRRRGQDRRRVHRPHHGGPALVGGPAPGRRGQGEREDPGGERDRRHGHDPELLPDVQEALRHDRHGAHRGERVPRHLQARGRADPDPPADGARSTRTTRSTGRRTRSSPRWSTTSSSATATGQPVLVGTISVEVSEHLSTLLEPARASRTRC